MKASELRIGNLLRDKVTKTELRVIKLTEQDIVIYVVDRSMFPLKDGWGIEPIPLTEEWLVKFGFEFRNTHKQYGWYLEVSKNRVLTWCHSREMSLEFDLEDYDYNNALFDFNCEYVHQLQNLYFALTNEELILNS